MQKGDIDPAPLPAPGHHRAAHLGHHFSATGYERHRTEYSLHDVELSALSAQRAALESLTQELKGVLDKVLGSDAGLRAAQPCAPPREAAATTAAGAPPPPVQAGGKPGMGAPRWNSVQDVLNRPSRRVSFSEPGGPTRGAEASSFWTAGRAQQDQEVERTGLSQVLAEVVDSGRIETPITHCAERRGRQKLYRPEMVDDFVRWVKKAGEDERQQATELTALYGATPCCRWVLLPDTVALHLWGIGLAGLIFLHAFFLPLHLAFGDDLDPTSSLRFLTFADVCFAIDIGLTFRTAVPSTQMARANAPLMETRGWRIAAHYACTWLVPDLLAALPYHLMPRRIAFSLSGAFEQGDVVASEGALAWLMLLRLLGLLRLLRVARSVEADRHHRWFGPRLELAMFFGLFMLLCHTLGCLHWFVADLELRSAMLANEEEQAASWGADGSGWLPPVRYASHVRTPGDAASASAFSCYMYALAWGAQNLIEPGQARPETIAQSTFTLVVVFFAMATQALIIGQMTTTINRMEASRNAKSAGRQVVDGYLESRDVPRKLRQRIHRFFDFVGSVSDVNAEELLENLPPQLKLQLELYHKRDVYLKNPVFKECRADEVVEIVQRVELLHASEGQYLVQEGHKSPGLYTIIRGSIEVLKGESPAQHGTHLRTRWPGEIFGEASLLGTGQLATASCVAAVMSELMLLRKDAWDDLVRLFPELHSRMERYASDKDRVGEGDAFAKCAQMHRDNADRRCAPSKADPFMV